MKNPERRWVVIYIAHTAEQVSAAESLLTSEGFLVKTRPVAKALSPGDLCFEVLSLTSEAVEARDLLNESGF